MDTKCKVSVVLPAEEFERFDSYCAEKGFKKSTLIVRLIREHMASEGYWTQARLPLGEAGAPPRDAQALRSSAGGREPE